MSGVREAANDVADRPRSERVARLFGFEPFGYQEDVLDSPESHVTWVCGRQVGKTETTATIVADFALMHADADVLVAARYQETANELFRRAKDHIENTGVGLERVGVETSNRETWEFANGSRIMSRTLGTDASQQRGKLPQCIVVEEAELVTADVYQRVIEPMFATHDEYELYLVGTPQGKSGYFYEKHSHDDDWGSYHVPTSANPLVDEEWLEARREDVDDITWRQEYLGEFIESEEAYLPMSVVRPCLSDESDIPDAPTGGCYLGVDVARTGRDRSVFVSIDEKGHVFDLQSTRNRPLTDDVGRIKALDERYGYDAIHVDENGVGGGVVDFAGEGLRHVEAVPFSTKRKQQMYQGLKKALEDGHLTLPWHDRLVDELTALEFSFTSTGLLRISHPSGGHDDYPDALALAVDAKAGDSSGGLSVSRTNLIDGAGDEANRDRQDRDREKRSALKDAGPIGDAILGASRRNRHNY